MNHKEFADRIGKYSIVYVEDNDSIREYISEFLTRYCKNIHTYKNAEDGIEAYKNYHPDIFLLDINLPKMSGIDFASYIRKYDKKTRILLLTAYTNQTFMLKAIELDITRYLIKPATSEELLKALEKCSNELEVSHIINLGGGYIYSQKLSSIISNNEKIQLRKKEIELLDFFIEHEGEVLRYEILENELWQESVMSRDTIRSQIRNLRKKIGSNCFENITGIGYRFKVNHVA